jgi:arylsulfatase A-like enzyme
MLRTIIYSLFFFVPALLVEFLGIGARSPLPLTGAFIHDSTLSMPITLMLHYLSCLSLGWVLAIGLRKLPTPNLRLVGLAIVVFFYIGFLMYRLETGDALHFSVILFAADELFNVQGLSFVFGYFKLPIVAGIGALLFVLMLVEKFLDSFENNHKIIPRYGSTHRKNSYRQYSKPRSIAHKLSLGLSVLFFALCSTWPPAAQNDLSYFVYSVFASTPHAPHKYPNTGSLQPYNLCHTTPEHTLHQATAPALTYPQTNELALPSDSLVSQSTADSALQSPPHVFMIFLESFSNAYAHSYTPQPGQPPTLTPVFDSLAQHGLFLPNSFSTNIVTIEGHFSTLCALPSSFVKNTFTGYFQDQSIQCLPHALQQQGYNTVFLKGYHNIHFQDAYTLAKHTGFTHVKGMDSTLLSPLERRKIAFNWGISDSAFYDLSFTWLDSLTHTPKQQPIFAALTTITNHMPFEGVPDSLQFVHPQPKTGIQKYQNTLYLSDQYLNTFFAQLQKRPYYKNTLVVLFGDHGNTKGHYSTQYRIPILFTGPVIDSLGLQVTLDQQAYSQLHIVPTILDIVQKYQHRAHNTTQLTAQLTTQSTPQSMVQNPSAPLPSDSSTLVKKTDPSALAQSTPCQYGDYKYAQYANEYATSALATPTSQFVPLVRTYGDHPIAAVRWPWQLVHNLRQQRYHLYNVKQDPDLTQDVYTEWQAHQKVPHFSQTILDSLFTDLQRIGNFQNNLGY